MASIDWTCEVCGNNHSLTPSLLKKEKTYHGVDKCGKSTTQQRVSLNVVNIVRKEGSQGESFAEVVERLIEDGLECRKRHPEP